MTTTVKNQHCTRDGLVMPIATMTDQHLLSTIKLICAQIKNLNKTDLTVIPKHLKVFVKDSVLSEEQLEKEVIKEADKLLPYLFFAILRPLIKDDVISLIYDAFGVVEPDTKEVVF